MAEEKKDFVIKDRRFFSEEKEGEKPSSTEKEAPPSSRPETDKPSDPETGKPLVEEAATAEERDAETQLPEINFSTFIFSLNASALVNLGIIDNPANGAKEKNLPLAKQTIDILGMLEEKTSGNLTDEEKNLLKNILYDLRLNYVKEKK